MFSSSINITTTPIYPWDLVDPKNDYLQDKSSITDENGENYPKPIDWEINPLMLEASVKDAMHDFDNCTSIISNTALSPSRKAKLSLSKDRLNKVIIRIDTIFEAHIRQYQHDLYLASRKDQKTYLETKHWVIIVPAVGFIAGLSPFFTLPFFFPDLKISAEATLGFFLYTCIASNAGLFGGCAAARNYVQWQSCVQRQIALKSIDIRECLRQKQALELAKQERTRIEAQMDKLDSKVPMPRNGARDIEQLNKLIASLEKQPA